MTMHNLTIFGLSLTMAIIALSPTVAGFCFRAAVVMPFAWVGLVDEPTARAIVFLGMEG